MYPVRVASRVGRCFPRKKERFDLEQLQPGDHIVEEEYFTLWHHMIVEEVDINQKQIHVIHYYNKRGPSGSGSVVRRSQFTYAQNKFYRIVYEDNECLPAPEVLEEAKTRIGEKEYNPLTNNCEHFANECKTGKKECHQVWTAIEILGETLRSCCIEEQVAELTISFELFVTREFLPHALVVCVRPKVKFDKGKLTGNDVLLLFMEHFENKQQISLANLSLSNLSLSNLVAVISETYLLYSDYSDTKAKLDEGKLTREETCTVVAKRVGARVGAAVGSIFGRKIGFYLGSFYNGSEVLRRLGVIVCGAVGRYLGREVGAFLAEPLTPFIEYLPIRKKVDDNELYIYCA